MLTNRLAEDVDLETEKHKAAGLLDKDLSAYLIGNSEITEITYPVLQYPEKVSSVGFDKMKFIEGELWGIKGQYLIFADGSVLNIRKHGGYLVSMSF